ncbi:VOC family protein [Couchioplanes caeruleus]|uniref:VOC family protein n=1 Tax=Couchioplanes caeruleus TaxID=56438 RepID=UPI0020C16D5F|nr:VOC family protein [Couchioplanes caeruleus]UQU66041.1 VOC family protein [Couchioplanes caeruleus]
MTVTGPDFIALQVRDLEKAAAFYETQLGLERAPVAPPHAVVFATGTVAFAVREPLPGVDLDAVTPHPGAGVVLWMGADDAQAVHDKLQANGVPIAVPPFDGPFGRTFTFTDPDGYAVTIHDRT